MVGTYEGWVCVLALGERLGESLDANTGLLEVVIVDANSSYGIRISQ